MPRPTKLNPILHPTARRHLHAKAAPIQTGLVIPSPYAQPYKIRCGSSGSYPISQCDFDRYARSGLLLSKPGRYYLTENINYRPATGGSAAITIAASGITLDLGGYTLAQVNQTENTVGIAVARDVQRVKIRGSEGVAQILDFTLIGIRVLGRTRFLTIRNLIVSQSVPRGLTNAQIPEDCSQILTLSYQVGILIGEGGESFYGFAGTSRDNRVADFKLQNVTAQNHVIGVQIVFAERFLIEDSLFTKNSFYGLLVGTAWLISEVDNPSQVVFPVASDFVIRRSHGDQNEGPFEELANPGDTFLFDFLSGLAFYETLNGQIEHSTANDNLSPTYLLAVDHDGTRGMRWSNCTTNGNRSTGYYCDGFHMSGSVPYTIGQCLGIDVALQQNYDAVIENHVSNSNRGLLDTDGLALAYVNGIAVNNCVAEGNRSDEGFGVGFLSLGTSGLPGGTNSNIVFRNCIAQSNTQAGFWIAAPSTAVVVEKSVANGNGSQGVLIWAPPNSFITPGAAGVDRIVIKDNTLNHNAAGGIVLLQGPEDLVITEVVIEDNTVSHNTGSGILLEGPIGQTAIKSNKLYHNLTQGIALVGTPATNLVAKNVVYSSTGFNFVGVPPATIIDATVSVLPDTVGLKNVSITNA